MGIDAEMFVRVRRTFGDAEIRKLQYLCAQAFGPSKFWMSREEDRSGAARVEPSGEEEEGWGNRHCLERVRKYEQDGDDIVPESGETFIRVYPKTRFYGKGYERGDLPFLVMLAWWLEESTGGEVWFGGDSSGVLAEPFGHSQRAELFRHFVNVGHEPYQRAWDSMTTPGERVSRECPFCCVAMTRNGWGGNGQYASFFCDGCGRTEVTRDGGSAWIVGKETP